MKESFGNALFLSFYNQLDEYLFLVFPKLMEAFGTVGRSFIILYIVIIGILIMKGQLGDKTKSFGFSMLLLPALWFMIMESHLYGSWIVEPLRDTVMSLSGFFIGVIQSEQLPKGSGLETLFNNLDSLSYMIFDLLFKVDPPGYFATNTWMYMQIGLLAAVLLGSYAAAYVTFLVTIAIGFFSMYVMFLVGGICIFFAAFQQTRFIFWAWLKSLINYALLIVFTSIVMSICFFGLDSAIKDLAALKPPDFFSPHYWLTICWSVLTFAVLRKAADYAAALSGGQAGSTSNIAGSIGAAAGAGASLLGFNAITGGGGVSGMDGKGLIQGVGGKLRQGLAAVGNRAYSNMKGIDTK